MPIIKHPTDFPPPPIDDFPYAVIDLPWTKARFAWVYPYTPPLFDKVKGWMRDATRDDNRKRYLFEVEFHGGVPRPKVSACDLTREDLNDDFLWRDDTGRKLGGLPARTRPDLHRRAVLAARDMRERALAQQRWLDDLFENLPRADVVDSDTGKAPEGPPREFAVHRGWLITRQDYPGGKWTYADRFFDGCASGRAGNLILRPGTAP